MPRYEDLEKAYQENQEQYAAAQNAAKTLAAIFEDKALWQALGEPKGDLPPIRKFGMVLNGISDSEPDNSTVDYLNAFLIDHDELVEEFGSIQGYFNGRPVENGPTRYQVISDYLRQTGGAEKAAEFEQNLRMVNETFGLELDVDELRKDAWLHADENALNNGPQIAPQNAQPENQPQNAQPEFAPQNPQNNGPQNEQQNPPQNEQDEQPKVSGYIKAFRQRRDELEQQIQQLVVPDASVDPVAAITARKRLGELRYLRAKLYSNMGEHLKSLPVEKQDQIYDNCVPEANRAAYKVVDMKNELYADALESEQLKNGTDFLNNDIRALGKTKKGFLMSKTDSPEHKKMMKQLLTVQYKIKQLKGEQLNGLTAQQQENLRKMDLGKEIIKARNLTYDYYRLKKENGEKDSAWYSAGDARMEAAKNTITHLNGFSKFLDLESQPVLDSFNQRMKTVEDADGNQRTDEAVSKAAATAIYNMMMWQKKLPKDKQEEWLEEDRMENNLQIIQNQPIFKRMMQNEGTKNISRYLAEGGGQLTDAFIRASNQVAQEAGQAQQKTLAESTEKEKAEIWTKQNIHLT